MKRTSSMVFIQTEEARELFLFALDDSILPKDQSTILLSLAKFYVKGEYNEDKAVDLWYYYMTNVANIYDRRYTCKFTVTQRFTAAVLMERERRNSVIELANDIKARQANKQVQKKPTQFEIYKAKKTLGYWSFGLVGLEVKEVTDTYLVAIYNAGSPQATLHKLKVYNTEKGSYVNFAKQRLYLSECISVG